jgi:hypothetical protein
MSVVIYKLSNGDEVIGERVGSTTLVKRPRVLQMMQTNQGVQAGLIPYIIGAPDAEMDFNLSHVVAIVDAPSDISAAYVQQTTGIQLASTLYG